MKFVVNQKVYVSKDAPFHAGRYGYFQFEGTAASNGTAVIATEPNGQDVFCVSMEHVLTCWMCTVIWKNGYISQVEVSTEYIKNIPDGILCIVEGWPEIYKKE